MVSIPSFNVLINGNNYEVSQGESLISVFINHGIFQTKINPVSGQARFGTCGMGPCYECEVRVERLGIRRACMISVNSNLIVDTGDVNAEGN